MLEEGFHLLCKAEVLAHPSLVLGYVLKQEAIGVVPGQENLFQYCFDPLLGEVEVVSLHQGGVYQVQPHRIGSKLVAHLNWVGVVLEPL